MTDTNTPAPVTTTAPAPGEGAAPVTNQVAPILGGAAAPATPAVVQAPETYDFKLPEGSPVKAEQVSALAKALGLPQEAAQKLADSRHQEALATATADQEAFNGQLKTWADTAAADKEFGGEAFVANVGLANRVLSKYGTPALVQELRETGLGNHPEVIRLLVRIGKASSEDTLVIGGTNQPVTKPPSLESLYQTPLA